MKTTLIVFAYVLAVGTMCAQQENKGLIAKEKASAIALEQVKGGTIQSAEVEKEEGKLVWSFDITSGKVTKEVWIDARTGAVLKTETESSVKESDEQAMDKAERAALQQVPGEVLKRDVEKENGQKIYSFVIKEKSGKVIEVEIDARTNKVVKVENSTGDEVD